MKGRDAIFIGGAIGLMVLAVGLLQFWSGWRKRSIGEAGAKFGFRRLTDGEALPVVLVPLIDRPNRTYFLILRGTLQGHEVTFFDLYCTSGSSWDYQSTVLIKNPGVAMPKFQLRATQWSQAYQRTCGDALGVEGRDKEMSSLRLSADDPAWARRIFSMPSPEFFQKVLDGKWTIEGLQHSLVIYRWGMRIPPRKLQEYVQQAADLAV